MKENFSYNMIYEILLRLREDFHSYGRIDDSNAKLDEIIKLVCVSFSLAKKEVKFNLNYIQQKSLKIYGDYIHIAESLRDVFNEEVQEPMFFNEDNTNIFGANIALNIQPTENEFAEKLITEIEKVNFVKLLREKKYSDFDLVNECFGHFVRENFRNNKEDAQYMTPYELVSPVLDIVFNDIEKDSYFSNQNIEDFAIMDPSCGVGTLLIEGANHFTRFIEKQKMDDERKSEIISKFRNNGVVGQDKVDRMVRLAKINMLLLGGNMSNIFAGNSIVGDNRLEYYKNRVDLIFTNPPFGAEYQISELALDDYPILKRLDICVNTISSELLLLDKCINMLKPNGYLVIILPDGVFSSKGINELYRKELLKTVDIRGIIELPDVTFAQAGTRTKTSVLYLRKANTENDNNIFMANCCDLGFIVKEKVGVPVKFAKGLNQMLMIAEIINSSRSENGIISENPSITYVSYYQLISNILKPGFYSANRLSILDSLKDIRQYGYEIRKLSEVVDFVTVERKSYNVNEKFKHISVLHINSDSTINFRKVDKYRPTSKGRKCEEGDLIFSRINPRIPRMAVIPKYNNELVCSAEFEIMRPKYGVDIYALCFLLKTKNVIQQMEDLTSGTSSSHCRIKCEQLKDIIIPYPADEIAQNQFRSLGKSLRRAIARKYSADKTISKNMEYLENIF